MNAKPPAANTERSTEHVVVGVDGTRTALNAVRWAVLEAGLRGLPLRIVHAAPYARPGPTPADGTGSRRVQGILGAAFTVARRSAPGVPVSTRPTTAGPVDALTEAARTAQLLVVGIPALGPHEILPTSVALDVIGHEQCPVAVVRGRITATDEPVLVGVDDPEHDQAALAAAFAEASLHRCGLVVLHAHSGLREHLPAHVDAPAAAARLAAALGYWSERFPDVEVGVRAPHDTATNALLAAADTARLVVVGTRGRGAALRALFGSHSRELVRHSPVPVLVVAPGARRPAPRPVGALAVEQI
jgi:nucleotide-binding universal stress UspA family protein